MDPQFTAFGGWRRIASGNLEEVALASHEWSREAKEVPLLVFEDATGRVVDLDLRGAPEEVLARLAEHPMRPRPAEEGEEAPPRSGPGRPRLGVVSKEVSLLPRHWEWLQEQPKSVSATLRLLVEERMKASQESDRIRRAEEAAYRVMAALAGDLPDFEEVARALFAHRYADMVVKMVSWPGDIPRYLQELLGIGPARS